MPFWSYGEINNGDIYILRENIMNILVFIPIGFFMFLGFSKLKAWMITSIGLVLSVFVEMFQYLFKKGFCEIDDVIHNTLGCVLGLVIAQKLLKCFK